ncbi:MAG: glycosyltransferase family 2 protein [Candidatus Aureabacteria bacterium]|nr:glycosyltransferase family 2 protein [Candidatus Auribacterota bacterium]
MRVCAVIPAYNEAARVGDVVREARGRLPGVVVVDDGSADGTADAARRAGAEVLRHPANRGKGAALKTGMGRAFDDGYDAVVVLDADGQHAPGEIPLFLEAAERTGADIVVGNRMENATGMPLVRYLTNRFTSAVVSKLAGQRIPDSQCGFRLINERAFRRMGFATSRFDTESEMLIEAGRAGCRIVSVPVRTIYGAEKSKINPFVDTARFFRLVARHLRRPR